MLKLLKVVLLCDVTYASRRSIDSASLPTLEVHDLMEWSWSGSYPASRSAEIERTTYVVSRASVSTLAILMKYLGHTRRPKVNF
ncbi:hypothetical protein SAMN05446635_3447 [Burkholderia sp. OK233]|nr:hypothetical protein SAMN05446635_3447 [Burkholderia sp. OK233]